MVGLEFADGGYGVVGVAVSYVEHQHIRACCHAFFGSEFAVFVIGAHGCAHQQTGIGRFDFFYLLGVYMHWQEAMDYADAA